MLPSVQNRLSSLKISYSFGDSCGSGLPDPLTQDKQVLIKGVVPQTFFNGLDYGGHSVSAGKDLSRSWSSRSRQARRVIKVADVTDSQPRRRQGFVGGHHCFNHRRRLICGCAQHMIGFSRRKPIRLRWASRIREPTPVDAVGFEVGNQYVIETIVADNYQCSDLC